MKIGGFLLVVLAAGAVLPAEDTVQLIFDRVAGTFHLGDLRRPPTLRIAAAKAENEGRGAYFDPDAREIVVDQRLVDHFRANPALGDDAFAFLFGHELGHFYCDHDLAFAATARGPQPPEHLARLRSIEEDADRRALIHSHLAGYRGSTAGPAAIHALYGLYGLKPELPGYPSLTARTSGTEILVERLRPLLSLYPLALSLILDRRLAEAALVIDYLGEKFQSPDFVHNAGVLQARIGLSKSPASAPYASLYPLLFATQNNMARSLGASRGGDDNARPHLAAAEERLRQVLRQAPQDAAARINLALVLDLAGRPGEGLPLLEGEEGFSGQMKSHRAVAQAILWHHSGQTPKAMQAVRRLSADNKSLWDAFFRNANPPRGASRKVDPPCPDLLSIAERTGYGTQPLWAPAKALKGMGKAPGDTYDLTVETVHTPSAMAARLRSYQTTLQVVSPSKITDVEQQSLGVYFRQAAPTAELAGVPVSYRLYSGQECSFVLGARNGVVIEVFLLSRDW